VKKILHNIIKEKTIFLIRRIGNGLNEIVFTIDLEFSRFDTIEYDEQNNIIILHLFEDDYDFVFDYEILDEEDKLKILNYLRNYLDLSN
jgi:hypothetical protein